MKQPPKFPLRFFRWFCHPEYVEDIEGDLLERFEKRPSKWKFTLDVLKLIRPSLIKPAIGGQKLNYYGMLKHNLLITFRGFLRHKTTFLINLLGLSMSLVCVIFIALWVNNEWQVDRFHNESEKLFQVYSRFDNTDGITVEDGVTGLLEPEIEQQIPQVSKSTVFTDVHEFTLSIVNNGLKAQGRFADEIFLELFNYPLIHGTNALNDPTKILISTSLAKKLFETENVVGETLNWHVWTNEMNFEIAGVFEDVPATTSEPFDFLLPWTLYHDELISFKAWGNYYGRVVTKVDDLNQLPIIQQKINEIFHQHVENDNVNLFLTNYTDKYLFNVYKNGIQSGGRIEYVYLVSIIAIFILIIASINFINLSTAYASLKAKEIGVKKVFGASKRTLAFQFFLESILLTLMATFLALTLVYILSDLFNQLTGKELNIRFNLQLASILLLFTFSVSFISGAYPAFYLASLKAVSSLKGKISNIDSNRNLGRRLLVITQFSISIILIVGTLIVGRQMEYVQHKNLGYDRENVLYFLREGKILDNKAFKNEIEKIPGVQLVSESGFTIGQQNRTESVSWAGKEDMQVQFWENNGDENSIDILGLEIVAGRSFDEDLNEDESIIINQRAAAIMGMENPVGEKINHYNGEKTIVGVVRDFTTESLHTAIEPTLFMYNPPRAHNFLVKIERGKELTVIGRIEAIYKEFNPNYPFEPRFIDQDYQAQYESETRVSKLTTIFSWLAILISCMGLFGLTIFNIQRRTKEIGIRKVLGSNSLRLALSLTFDFTKTVFISLLVAIPISYILGIKWLENFAYNIQLEWWMFVVASLAAISIAWITVGSQTFRAASANPISSLKDE